MTLALWIVLALLLAAAACVVAGIWLLVGLGWALVAMGVQLLGAALLIRAGLRNG